MTRLFFSLCFSFLSLYTLGQSQHIKQGDHIRYPLFDNFAGTWEWRSDSTVFTLCLQKAKVFFTHAKVYKEIIIGWHSYWENGKLIESTMDRKKSDFEWIDTAVIRSASFSAPIDDSAFVSGSIKDITRNRDFYATLKLVPGKDGWAIWESAYQAPNPFRDTTKIYPKFRTVPTGIILKKITN